MRKAAAFVFLLLPALLAPAKAQSPCAAVSPVSDVKLTLALKDHAPVFEQGEIIPLALTFTSTTEKRYWLDELNSGHRNALHSDDYCVEPDAADPLGTYFNSGFFGGGGLGTTYPLGAKPVTRARDLNEWRALAPGHYRVFAISNNVWRPSDPHERTQGPHVMLAIRSNAIELTVRPTDTAWQAQQLSSALRLFAAPHSEEDLIRAARTLRFLNTEESTAALARLFDGVEGQAAGGELMYGLYGSPYRQLAIDTMRAEISAPAHPITGDFIRVLVRLQGVADPAWESPDLTKTEIAAVVAALPRKTGSARAITLNALLGDRGVDPAIAQTLRPALIASWADLPLEMQQQLIAYQWPLVAGKEMLPILRKLIAEPPPPARTTEGMTRNAALTHLFGLDPAAGREAILADLRNPKAQPGLKVVGLLQKEDVSLALGPAVERIRNHAARELDFDLIDRYADASYLSAVQTVFEQGVGKWACAPQTAMLRYFLRVSPDYGAEAVKESLAARELTGCYKQQLQALGDALPKAQQSAIDALDDPNPEVVQDAVITLGRWGTADAEPALWARLKRFHDEWAGRTDELRSTPDYQSPGSRAVALEQGLVNAIASGVGWICPPEELARLPELTLTAGYKQAAARWMQPWKQGTTLITPNWYPEDSPTFSVLQYQGLSLDQLRAKLAQLPAGMKLRWQFQQPGQNSPISIERQEEVYDEMRAIAERHELTLDKANRSQNAFDVPPITPNLLQP